MKMGYATRTTKVSLDCDSRRRGGMNVRKRNYLETTVALLNRARAFYVDFLLAHREKLSERITYVSQKDHEERERTISADELLTWIECCTVSTAAHPTPLAEWNFSAQFPDMPVVYRRSVIKDAIGKVRSYLSHLTHWQQAGKKKGKPGQPGAANHPTLYQGTFSMELEELDRRGAFVRLKVYTGEKWAWVNYPMRYSRWHEERLNEAGWEMQSPKLILRPKQAEIHVPQVKTVKAKKVNESKLNPDLVTVGVDLNVKNLAVITVRQHGQIVKTIFVRDKGLDQHRYRHLKRVSKRQWQSGKPVKGERNCRTLWDHIRRTNQDVAHKTARTIAEVCSEYPGCVLLFERLRKLRTSGGSKSRRRNRKQANQMRGLIRDYAKDKAFRDGTVTVEVNPHGTSQYCARCGSRDERFSLRNGQRVKERGGKLFQCLNCQYEAHADYNASVNLHRSFYREYHWQPHSKAGYPTALPG